MGINQVGPKGLNRSFCPTFFKKLAAGGSIEVFGGVGTFFQKGSDPPEAKYYAR